MLEGVRRPTADGWTLPRVSEHHGHQTALVISGLMAEGLSP